MPGITGIIATAPRGDELQTVERMLQVMLHESFYTSGVYCNPELGAYVGYAAIAGSFSDCMPIRNERGDLVLLLAGECFVDRDVKAGLRARGHDFKEDNAEFLVHLYEEQGEEFFGRLNGWFSGLIVDLRRKELSLFNDRYGVRKMYHYEEGGTLYFASEAKSILKVRPSLRSMNRASLGEYAQFDCVLEDRTLFSQVCLMPAGSVWRSSAKGVQKRRHFDPRRLENATAIPEEEYYARLDETLVSVVPRYLEGKGQMVALTGGLDTRVLMACVNPKPRTLPCFTQGGMYRDMLDVCIARKVAAACQQDHHVLTLGREFLSRFPLEARRTIYLTDGLLNVCQAHLVWLNQAARAIGSIRLGGMFGSQVLKHVSAFHRPTGYDGDERLIHQDLKPFVDSAKLTFASHAQGHPLSVMITKEIPWWWGGASTAAFSQLTVRSPYLDNDFVELLYQSPRSGVDFVRFQMGLTRKRCAPLYHIMTDRGFGGSPWPIIAVPQRFLYRLISWTGRFYERDKLPYSLQHTVARLDRLLLSPLGLDALLLGIGDYRHFRKWFRDDLSEYLQGVLLDPRTLNRGYWNRRFLEQAVRDHVKGRRNQLPEIRKTLTIELIQRALIEEI